MVLSAEGGKRQSMETNGGNEDFVLISSHSENQMVSLRRQKEEGDT